MRISTSNKNDIVRLGKKYFGNDTKLYLFGSRVDNSKKGGDIDLYIAPKKYKDRQVLFEQKLKLLASLYKTIGEQKIDIIIASDKTSLIEQEALKNGVEL